MSYAVHCKVSLPGMDDGDFPVTQATYYGSTSDVVTLEPWGFHSVPPVDSLGVYWCVNDNSDKFAMFYGHKDRPKDFKPGETVLYNATESMVKLLDNGDIEIIGANDLNVTVSGDVSITVSGDVDLTATTLNITADVNITGDTVFTGSVDANGKSIDETHKHTGVTVGGGVTGTVQ